MEPHTSNDKVKPETEQGASSSRTPSHSRSSELPLRPTEREPKTGPGKQEIAISRWLQFIKVEKRLHLDIMEHRRRFLAHEMEKDDEMIRKFLKANSKSPILVWLKKLYSERRHYPNKYG